MKTLKTSVKSSPVIAPPVLNAPPKPAANTTPVLPAASNRATGTTAAIDIIFDVGFGNAIFIRGQGAGLSWERGTPLVCVDGTTWRWSGMIKDKVTFKPLINDRTWAAGNDLILKPGENLRITPNFT